MAISYWHRLSKPDGEYNLEVKRKRKATNPPDMYYVYYQDWRADFHKDYDEPIIVPLSRLEEGLISATMEPELIGISDA